MLPALRHKLQLQCDQQKESLAVLLWRTLEILLQIGESPNLIQLLEPLSAESPVQKQIDRNGGCGGLAHVGLRVKSAQAAFDFLKAQGFRIVDDAPRPGSRGTTVFFIHPKSHQDAPFGVLYEIVEDPNAEC